MVPAVSQKRNWYSRDAIQATLQALGLPAVMDGTHVVFRGYPVEAVTEWLVARSSPHIAGMMTAFGTTARWTEALRYFESVDQMISIKHLVSPGMSIRGNRAVVDGAAMAIQFLEGSGAGEGPTAYVVPVHKEMLNTGEEWVSMVAMIPTSVAARWARLVDGAAEATRLAMTDGTEVFVYNGSNYRIQPIQLSDIWLTPEVRSGFVDDITGFLTREDWYKSRRIAWTRRYILNGPPGTGKTTVARWAASSLGLAAMAFDFTDRWADGRDFARFMDYARRRAPSIVILDDFEKIMPGMGGENQSAVTAHSILTALSGMSSMDGVIVLATTNSTDKFAGPMRRRFDSVIEFEYPPPEQLLAYMKGMLHNDPVEWRMVAPQLANSFIKSYDDARAAVTAAANNAVKDGRLAVDTMDVLHGIKGITRDRTQQAGG